SSARSFFPSGVGALPHLHSSPTRRSSDLEAERLRHPACSEPPTPSLRRWAQFVRVARWQARLQSKLPRSPALDPVEIAACQVHRSEEHTSELQSRENVVCRLLLEKKNIKL